MRVLFVEDSETLGQTVGATLRRSGWAVDVCRDGEDGLWHATNHDYDVVILDLMLPKLDGLSVLRNMRAQGRNTPVLLLTAKTSVPDRVIGLNHGADDYLGKPFALEELLARLSALARRHYDQGRAVLEFGAMCDLPHLFERFWRKDESRSGGGHGGLGLSLARELARVIKCELGATSNAERILTMVIDGLRPAPPGPEDPQRA